MAPSLTGWSWQTGLALLATLVARMICCGSVFSIGVYYQSIRAEFERSHMETAIVFSLSGALVSGAGLVVGWLLRHWSERTVVMCGGLLASLSILASVWAPNLPTLILTLGLLNGFGQGLAFVTVPVAGSFLFPEAQHHVAMGIQNTGDGIGLTLFPLLYELIIPKYSWRSSLLVVAGVVSVLCVCGAALKTPEMERLKTEGRKASLQHQLSSGGGRRWGVLSLLFAAAFLHQVGFVVYFTFLFPHLISLHIHPNHAAWIMMSYGIASIVTRLGTIFLDNRGPFRRWIVFAVSATLEGALIVVVTMLPGLVLFPLTLFPALYYRHREAILANPSQALLLTDSTQTAPTALPS